MFRVFSLLTVLLLSSQSVFCVDIYSIANGNWNSGSTWSLTPGGPACNCTPASSDNITINHQVNLTMHLINQGSSQNGITGVLTINAGASLTGNYDVDIRSSGTLILCGTLDVRNVIFSNGSVVEVCPSGNLIINGTFENKNSSNNVTINGNMTVHGTFTNGNGGIIGGSGNITLMTGPVSNVGTTFGCTGNPCGSFPCSVAPCSPLPITLVSFYASARENKVELEWATASEKNNDFFTIEKSLDGFEYNTVLTIKGAGNSDGLIKYNAIDITPFTGVSYYRLKQTDFDGQFSYSLPVAVKIQSLSTFQLLPNPSNGKEVVVVTGSNTGAEVSFSVKDLAGRTIISRNERISGKSKTTFLLDPDRILGEGIYLVSIQIGDEMVTQKVVLTK